MNENGPDERVDTERMEEYARRIAEQRAREIADETARKFATQEARRHAPSSSAATSLRTPRHCRNEWSCARSRWVMALSPSRFGPTSRSMRSAGGT